MSASERELECDNQVGSRRSIGVPGGEGREFDATGNDVDAAATRLLVTSSRAMC
jgi:hypothetical protein